jgi:ubiquinone/menaquinone biosynthesis C-methylase UbiE
MLDNTRFEPVYLRTGAASQRHYPNENLIQFLARNLFHLPRAERRGVKILELGCGTGANLWMVAREGFGAYGVDIAPTGLKFCREKLSQWGVGADLQVSNMRMLPFRKGAFDVVFDVHSMQHTDLEGHRAAYGEAFRCLKPGGLFYQFHLGKQSYSYTQGGGIKIDKITIDDVRREDAPYANGGLMSFLDVKTAERVLADTGFVDVEMERLVRSQLKRDSAPIKTEFLSISCRRPMRNG